MAKASHLKELSIEQFPAHRYALNRYHLLGQGHPFTCANRDGHVAIGGIDAGLLVATNEGWVCPCCEYRQDWAWAFMAETPSPYRSLQEQPQHPRSLELWEGMADRFCRIILALQQTRRVVPYPERIDPLIEDARQLKGELLALRPTVFEDC